MLRTGDGNPNAAGAEMMGLTPFTTDLAGAKHVFLCGDGVEQNEDLSSAAFVLVADCRESQTILEFATVVLPGVTAFEKRGSFTNVDGRIQRVEPSVRAPGSALEDWKLLGRLLAKLTGEDVPTSADAVLKSMGATRPAFEGLSLGRLGPLGKPAATASAASDTASSGGRGAAQ